MRRNGGGRGRWVWVRWVDGGGGGEETLKRKNYGED